MSGGARIDGQMDVRIDEPAIDGQMDADLLPHACVGCGGEFQNMFSDGVDPI